MMKAIANLEKVRFVEALIDGLLVASLLYVSIQSISQEMYSLATILFVVAGALATRIIANEKIFSFFMSHAKWFLIAEYSLYCAMTMATLLTESMALRWIVMGVLFGITFGVRRSMWEKVKEMTKNGRLLEVNNTYSYQSGMVVGLVISCGMGFFLGSRIDLSHAVLLDTYTTGMSSYGFWCVLRTVGTAK